MYSTNTVSKRTNFSKPLTTLLLLIVVMIISCSTINSGDVAGTISETEGGLMGIVASSAGIPQKNVTVTVYGEDISSIRAERSDWKDSLIAIADTITNELGEYHFPYLASGTYYIEGTKFIDSVLHIFSIGNIEFDSAASASIGYNLGTSELSVAEDSSYQSNLKTTDAVGYWKTYFSSDAVLYFCLKEDGTSWQSQNTGKSGTWSVVDGEIHVEWEDDWKDRIVQVSESTTMKYAYSPSMSIYDSVPYNSKDASLLQPLPTPVAHWPLNGDAEDIQGGNSGTLMGTTLATGFDTNVEGALRFDKQDVVQIPEDSSLAFTSSFSISLWYNKAAHETSDRDFLVFRGSPETGGDSYFISLEKEAVWKFHIEDSLGVVNDLTLPIETSHFGTWVHLSAVFNVDDQTMKLYFDGVEAASQTTTVTPYGSRPGTTQNIRIGGYFATGYGIGGETGLFRGDLDDVMFFNQALTPEEILTLAGM